VQKEAWPPVDNWDSQILIKPSRLVINRFRRKPGGHPGLAKKLSDFGAKDVDEIVDPSLDHGFITICGHFRTGLESRYVDGGCDEIDSATDGIAGSWIYRLTLRRHHDDMNRPGFRRVRISKIYR